MKRGELRTDLIIELLDKETPANRKLFSKALNIYVSPATAAKTDKEKMDLLRKMVEESLDPSSDL